MVRVRKKPVVVDAIQWTGDNIDEVRLFIGAAVNPVDGALPIQTREGTMLARPGAWIIRGVKGEYYPCENSIFEETYDFIEEKSELMLECECCHEEDTSYLFQCPFCRRLVCFSCWDTFYECCTKCIARRKMEKGLS